MGADPSEVEHFAYVCGWRLERELAIVAEPLPDGHEHSDSGRVEEVERPAVENDPGRARVDESLEQLAQLWGRRHVDLAAHDDDVAIGGRTGFQLELGHLPRPSVDSYSDRHNTTIVASSRSPAGENS